MKLTYSSLNLIIDFDNNFCQSLIVENAHEFFNITNSLYQQTKGENGKFVLYDKEMLDLSKHCLLFFDYYDDINTKKISSILNTLAMKYLKENDFLEEFSQLNKIMLLLNQKIEDNLNIPIGYNDTFSFNDFVKFSNYKLIKNENILDNIIKITELNAEYNNTKLVIFFGAFSIFDEKDFCDLIKQLHYMDINVLFVDSYKKYNIANMSTTIIDNDLCVI